MGVVPQTSTIYEVLEELAIAVQARARPLMTSRWTARLSAQFGWNMQLCYPGC